MSVWEHLDELRSRVVKALLALGAGTVVAWIYREPILAWLWEPFVLSWRAQHIPGDPTLNFAAPSDAFKAYLKLSFAAGLLIAAPFIFYQLWAFIASGLHKKEKRFSLPFVLSSTFLFVGGGLFGWRVCFPITFGYFLGLAAAADTAGVAIQPLMMMGEYVAFVGQMLLAFGFIFELPIFVLFLSMAGIVNYLQLIRFGRWFVLIAFTIGGVLTPPEVASQIVMSLPLCVLYFLSIGLAYAFGKRPSQEELARARADRVARRDAKKAGREAKRVSDGK
jgi:sec-independent protein translocase protein TatC